MSETTRAVETAASAAMKVAPSIGGSVATFEVSQWSAYAGLAVAVLTGTYTALMIYLAVRDRIVRDRGVPNSEA